MNTNSSSGRRLVLFGSCLLFIVCLAAFSAGAASYRLVERRVTERYDQPLGVFWEAWDLLDQSFYGELPPADQRTYGAIRGVLGLLGDPYTNFLEPPSSEIEQDRLAGAYGGIGVDLWRNGDGQVVLSPYPASPAEGAGVQAGDILLAVDGDSVETSSIDDIRLYLRGEVDTEVVLSISRPPTPSLDLVIRRAEIQIPSVTYRVLDQDPSTGYLHITGFTERTPSEAQEAVESLLAAGVIRLVLDLRDNGGGLIHSTVEVAGLFLDDRVVLYEMSREQQEEAVFRTRPGGIATDIPLVVLVNSSTASASEMLAGAVQVHERGLLIGDSTFGKGSVQHIYTLSDGSALHVTFAIWFLPNREPLSSIGLSPDILVNETDEIQDATLERALHYYQVGE